MQGVRETGSRPLIGFTLFDGGQADTPRRLFIGRGSDGNWYYSTFHFCRDMTTLRVMEEWQPDSLAQFTDAYLLVPFDGQSDECLKATWTGAEPFGLEKVQMAGTTKPAQ